MRNDVLFYFIRNCSQNNFNVLRIIIIFQMKKQLFILSMFILAAFSQGENTNRLIGRGNTFLEGGYNSGQGNDNIFSGSNNEVNGDKNNFEGNRNDVVGNQNDIEGDQNGLQGNENTVTGRQNFISGGKNMVIGDGNMIIGSGNSVNTLSDEDSRKMAQEMIRRIRDRFQVNYPM